MCTVAASRTPSGIACFTVPSRTMSGAERMSIEGPSPGVTTAAPTATITMRARQDGNLLVLDRITLEVAEACSGLQSLLSLFSVTAVTVTTWLAAFR